MYNSPLGVKGFYNNWVALRQNQQNDRNQADLSFRWAHMPFCWFYHKTAQLYLDHWDKREHIYVGFSRRLLPADLYNIETETRYAGIPHTTCEGRPKNRW